MVKIGHHSQRWMREGRSSFPRLFCRIRCPADGPLLVGSLARDRRRAPRHCCLSKHDPPTNHFRHRRFHCFWASVLQFAGGRYSLAGFRRHTLPKFAPFGLGDTPERLHDPRVEMAASTFFDLLNSDGV